MLHVRKVTVDLPTIIGAFHRTVIDLMAPVYVRLQDPSTIKIFLTNMAFERCNFEVNPHDMFLHITHIIASVPTFYTFVT